MKTVTVKMKSNLIMEYCLCPEFNYTSEDWRDKNELLASKRALGWMAYFKTKQLLKSIEGKVVMLIKPDGSDAFLISDNNVWIPDGLFTEL